jgi:hypothetical protein
MKSHTGRSRDAPLAHGLRLPVKAHQSLVVLVHGIAQENLASDFLEKDWLPALAGGVRNAGFKEIAERIWRRRSEPGVIETRMAFYGNLFLRPDQQGDGPSDLNARRGSCRHISGKRRSSWRLSPVAVDTGPDHLAILERNGDDFPERFKLYCA